MITPGHRLIHDPEGLNSATWPIQQEDLLTPADCFFTRSHGPTPTVDAGAWRLEIGGLVECPMRCSLDDLAAYPRAEVPATLVCAGLRRDEYLAIGPLPGELPWGPEPVSTGCWNGVVLAEVLRQAKVKPAARFVEFVGLDSVERHGRRFGFGGSIELDKALSGDVLLATELNGAPLPPDHGFPVRALVPGWIGARSVKWLGRITLTAEPSDNYFQSKAYRVQREVNHRDPRDVSGGTALSEVPLNAVILEPTRDQAVAAGPVLVRGWAMGSGGRPLTSVEVSPNAGADWRPARIAVPGAAWTWSLWEATLDLARGRHMLAVRARDTSGATQPAAVWDTWNVKGYANNAWHRVPVQAE
jgi:sulfite oxidase